MKSKDQKYAYNDERGLIHESYNINDITFSDCRSIFLDWLLGLNDELDPKVEINNLYQIYFKKYSDHPMTKILKEGKEAKKRIKIKRRKKN